MAVRSDDRSALFMRTDLFEYEMIAPALIKQPLRRQDMYKWMARDTSTSAITIGDDTRSGFARSRDPA